MSDVPSTELLQILELNSEVKRLRARVAELEAGAEAFNCAINYAIEGCGGDAVIFLNAWREGDWQCLVQEFPDFGEPPFAPRPVKVPDVEAVATVEIWNQGGSGEFVTATGIEKLPHGTKLYTEPQPVKVPESKGYEDAPDTTLNTDTDEAWADGWNACREAMLAAQENDL